MGVRLTHVGGPTVLIELGGWRLLTDPTFDPAGGKYSFGLGTGSRKLTEPAIPAADLDPIDAVLLSHDHHEDNLDAAGRALLPAAGAVVTTASGAKRLRGELSGDLRGLAAGETTTLSAPGKQDVEIAATPCRHGPPLSHPLVGDVVGFALRLQGEEKPALWITGDTVLHGAVREVAGSLEADAVLLHLGGVRFPISGPLRYTMNAGEAAELIAIADPRVAVPVHYEGWAHFREPASRARQELSRPPFQWLELGTPTEV